MASNDPNEMIQGMMTATGALAEFMWMQHQNFLRVGFNEKQATYLCGKIVGSFLNRTRMEPSDDD